MSWFTKRKLLKRWEHEPNAIENEFLNGLRLWILRGCEASDSIYTDLSEYMKDAFIKDPSGGVIFLNHPDEEVRRRGSNSHLSHDQIKAAIYFSIIAKKNYHKIFWQDTKFMHYKGTRLRIADWTFLGLVNNNLFCFLIGLPIMTFFMMGSFIINRDIRFKNAAKAFNYSEKHIGWLEARKEKHFIVKVFVKDSGPTIWWTQVESMKKADIRYAKYFNWLIKKLSKISFGDPLGILCWYYQHNNDHPIVKEINRYLMLVLSTRERN